VFSPLDVGKTLTTDLPFFESYTGQSTSELVGLEGQFRADSIVLAFEDALLSKELTTTEEKVILAIEGLEREASNGGLRQFFENSSNEFVPQIVDALMAIGCPETAELLKAAMTVLKIDESMTSEDIEDIAYDATDEQGESLSKLDEVYYEGKEEPIADKLFEFIKRNQETITISTS
jgi:hypothetical protein